jgi:hypothetical protein
MSKAHKAIDKAYRNTSGVSRFLLFVACHLVIFAVVGLPILAAIGTFS